MDNTKLSVWTALIDDDALITSAEKRIVNVSRFFNVMQNYPNPFNPLTTIPFNLNKPGKVKISIYDSIGRKIKKINKYYNTPGVKELSVDLGKYSSGIYYYKVSFDGNSFTKKMTLLK